MKRIVIILIGLISVAYGQSAPTSAKTRFVNGLYVGTKLDSYFAAADSNAIYWRADSVVMAKYKGTARALAFAVSGGYLPISDTAAMLSDYVDLGSTQTIAGLKTFTSTVNSGGSNFVTGGAVWVNGNIEAFNGKIGFGNSDRSILAKIDGTGSGMAGGNNVYFTSGSPSIPRAASNGASSGYYYSGGGSVNFYASSFESSNAILTPQFKIDSVGGLITMQSLAGSGDRLIKANSTGVLSAAVAGTDYVAPSALSGYVDLTTTQTVGGLKTFNNFLRTVTSGSTGIQAYDSQRGYFVGMITGSSDSLFVINYDSGYNQAKTRILEATKAGRVTLPLLTVNGATSLGVSSGNVGIGTASPDAKLRVSGTFNGSQAIFGVVDGRGLEIATASNGTNEALSILDARGAGAGELDLRTNGTSRMLLKLNGDIISLGVYNATVGGTNRDVFVDNTGLIGYVSSFRASKKNIQPFTNTSWIYGLNPVTFNYRVKDSLGNYTDSAYKELEYGLIAEEVEPINKEMVFYDVDSSGKKLRGVHYSKLIIPLLAEIKEHKKKLDAQQAIIEALLTRIQKLEAKLN